MDRPLGAVRNRQEMVSPDTGRRHLKRLSLANSSPCSPRARPPAHQTPRHAHTSATDLQPSVTPHESLHALTPASTSSANSRRTRDTPVSPHLGMISEDAIRSSPRAHALGHHRPLLAHARRQSSISYRSSPSSMMSPASGASASPAVSPLAARTRPMTGYFDSPSLTTTHEDAEVETEPIVDEEQPSPKPGDIMHAGTTLVQQHGELLSFIAQKERRCLDLREELKKQEDELRSLKIKWEGIVAREVASSRAQPMLDPSAKPTSGLFARRSPNASPDLQTTSGEPIGLGVTSIAGHTSTDIPPSPGQQMPDISAAKRWMSGLVKSGMAALENLAVPLEELPPVPPLQNRRRPSEDLTAPPSPSTSSAISDRRRSVSSLTTDESACFIDGKTTRTSSVSSLNHKSTSIDSSQETLRCDVTITAKEKEEPALNEADVAYAAKVMVDSVSPTKGGTASHARSAEEDRQRTDAQAKHSRRRSTFDMLGQAATTFGSGLGKRWGEVTGSEAFRNSKRATMNLVDTVERTLAEAIILDDHSSAETPEKLRIQHESADSTQRHLTDDVASAQHGKPCSDRLDALAEEGEDVVDAHV